MPLIVRVSGLRESKPFLTYPICAEAEELDEKLK